MKRYKYRQYSLNHRILFDGWVLLLVNLSPEAVEYTDWNSTEEYTTWIAITHRSTLTQNGSSC